MSEPFDISINFEPPATVGNALEHEEGFLSHAVHSPFQAGETKIHVLLPQQQSAEALKTLYVLPVERFDGHVCGDALAEIRRHGLHNKHQLICVMPTFSHAPWYADHPTAPQIRQESYFLKVVIPFVEKTYRVQRSSSGRLLLGFSKSGWGAYSLLLRHPEIFSRAAAWDAPLGQQSPNKYGMGEVFPNQYALDRYCVWDLLKQQANLLTGSLRFALLGHGVFRGHHQATHYRMLNLGIPHAYEDGPGREHHWESGWVSGAINYLAIGDCSGN
jgi:hypothetical protein